MRHVPSALIRRGLPLLLCLFAGAAAAQPRTIANPEQPRDGVQTVELRELWRAGGEDDEIFFGNVLQVAGGPEGEVYILDSQLLQVFVFAADGTFLRTVGGRGEGPGEVNNINSIVVFDEGLIGLGQVLPGKLALVDREGTPAGLIRITDPEARDSGFVLLMNGRAHGQDLVLCGMRWRMSDEGMLGQDMFLRRYDRQGVSQHEFLRKTAAFDATHFVFDEGSFDFVYDRYALTRDGRLAFAPERNAYEIRVCGLDGAEQLVITRPYASCERDGEALREAKLSNEALGSNYGRELMGVTVEKTEPDIKALWAADDGSLLVRTSRGDRERPAGVLTTVDVLDAQGVFTARRQLKCPGDPARDGIHLLPGGRVVVVLGAIEAYRREQATTRSGNQETPLEVICYGPVGG